MSSKNQKIKGKKKKNINLLYHQRLNIFPEDFFSSNNNIKSKSIKTPYNHSRKNINLSFNNENNNTEQNSLYNCTYRNNTATNFAKPIKKFSNIIKLDKITKIKFWFKQKESRSKFIKSKSASDLDEKNNESLFNNHIFDRKQLNNKEYYMNIYNNKMKNVNIKSNELFKESELNLKKLKLNNNKSKLEFLKNKNYTLAEISKENTSHNNLNIYAPSIHTPQNSKFIKMAKSNNIYLKYPKLKEYILSKQYLQTESEKNQKIIPDINKFNKRAFSSKNNKKKHIKIDSNNNYERNTMDKKENIKVKIKNTIDNIFEELEKNYENNPIIFNKFNSLIRDVKNIQKVIKHKKASIFYNKSNYEKLIKK